MRITELHRYPVKSMLGESLTSAGLGSNGIAGDRAWAVRQENTTVTGKKHPELMSARASFTAEPTNEKGSASVSITLPSGEVINTGDANAAAALGSWLQEDVKLWPLVSADDLDFFRRKAQPDVTPEQMEQELRAVFSRLPDEPLPDMMNWPAEVLEYESPPGTYFDAYPILLVSRKALDTLQTRAPNNFDMRRFRPNLVIEGPYQNADDAFPENALVGKHCQIGDALLSIEMECPRCIMTTHPFADVPKDPGIMRELVKNNGGNFGVYARVLEPGVVNVGDTLQIRD